MSESITWIPVLLPRSAATELRAKPEAAHQPCQVHYMRNVLSYVSTDAVRAELITGLRDAWAAPTRDEARARIARLTDKIWERKVSALADWLEETAEQTLACYELPAGVHRQRLRSTNSVEHDHADIRRRTRVVRIFPNDASPYERSKKRVRKRLWIE